MIRLMMHLWKFPGQRIGVEMSKLVVFSLFVTSFLPLWISIIIYDLISIYNHYDTDYFIEIAVICTIIVLNAISMIALNNWLKIAQETASKELILVKSKENKTISAEFLLSYILPVIAFDFTKWDSILLFVVFFSTLVYVCLRHNHISLNILLEIMGYSQYDCVLKKENSDIEIERMVISKVDLNSQHGSIVRLNHLNNDISLIVE